MAEAGRLTGVNRPAEAAARRQTLSPTERPAGFSPSAAPPSTAALPLCRGPERFGRRPGPGHGPSGRVRDRRMFDFWFRRRRRHRRDPRDRRQCRLSRTRQSGHGHGRGTLCQAEPVHAEEVQQTGAGQRQTGIAAQVVQAAAQGQTTDLQKTRLSRLQDQRRDGASTLTFASLLNSPLSSS